MDDTAPLLCFASVGAFWHPGPRPCLYGPRVGALEYGSRVWHDLNSPRLRRVEPASAASWLVCPTLGGHLRDLAETLLGTAPSKNERRALADVTPCPGQSRQRAILSCEAAEAPTPRSPCFVDSNVVEIDAATSQLSRFRTEALH